MNLSASPLVVERAHLARHDDGNGRPYYYYYYYYTTKERKWQQLSSAAQHDSLRRVFAAAAVEEANFSSLSVYYLPLLVQAPRS